MNKSFLTGCLFLSGLGASAAMAAPGFTLEPKLTFGGGDAILAPGDRTYLTTDSTQRGLGYNAVTNHLYVVNRAGGLSVNILDANTGADLGALNVTGITGGTFALNAIGVGSDGAIYAANLTTNSSTSPLKIYRWANEAAVPTVAFTGAPGGASGARLGDNLDVRGSGTGTQIALGGNSGVGAGSTTFNSYAVMTTANGTDFTGNGMTLTGPANGAFRLGVAFGPGDTVYGKQGGVAALEGTNFTLPSTAARLTGSPFSVTVAGENPIDIDAVNTLLATVEITTSAVRLYDIQNATANPVLLDTETLIGTSNANTNGTGALAFGNGMLWVMNTNNGIQAFNVVIPEPASLALLGMGSALLTLRRRP